METKPILDKRLAAAAAILIAASMIASFATERPSGNGLKGIQKIRHVIIILQENRSFDNYFGTYPGADGIPMKNGVPTVCAPDPVTKQCVKPYLNHNDVNYGGPHGQPKGDTDTAMEVDGGKMDGFIIAAQTGGRGCIPSKDPLCQPTSTTDVMGYHDSSDIPNYWAYAKNFALQDHMFESLHGWSFPAHLWIVSGWSASCSNPKDPMSCVGTDGPNLPKHSLPPNPTLPFASTTKPFAWTDLTYLLDKYRVSWGWYLDDGKQPFGNDPKGPLAVPSLWNVLPGFTDVTKNNERYNIQDISKFFLAARTGFLPQVSWILPTGGDSEHPPMPISRGQSYVTNIINSVMRSPDWDSTAIFLVWDDWGGFYDNVPPPTVDSLGYGMRVPSLVISPYAKAGYIDHQTLSFDAYLKFIEDDFMAGARLDPKTDGRPDSRPDVRENNPILGNLAYDFNFNQAPRPPLLLPVYPATSLVPPKNSRDYGNSTSTYFGLGSGLRIPQMPFYSPALPERVFP